MTPRLATRRRMRWIVSGSLALHWTAAWAAIVSAREAAPDLLALPWAQAALGVVIALGGGLTSSLMRYAASKSAKPGEITFNVQLEFLKDGAAAACIGVIGYFFGWTYSLAADELAAYLVLGGFSAARLLTLSLAIMERKLKLRSGLTKPGDLT
jgi:hypothetical protein